MPAGLCTRVLGLPGGDYRCAAEAITAAGYPTSEQSFKDARRLGGDLPEHLFPRADPVIDGLLCTLLTIWPEFEAERLVDGPQLLVGGRQQLVDLPAQNRETAQVKAVFEIENLLIEQGVTEKVETVRTRSCVRATPLSTKADPGQVLAGYSVDELERGWGIYVEPSPPWFKPLSFLSMLRPDEGGELLTEELAEALTNWRAVI